MTSNSEKSPLKVAIDLAILLALGFGFIFCVGVVAGFFGAAADHGPTTNDVVIGLVVLLLAALCGWQLVARTLRLLRAPREKVGPSVRKSRNLWAFFIGTGLLVGIALPLVHQESRIDGPGDLTSLLFSATPFSPSFAAALLAGLVIVTIASIYYYRVIDEHDFASQAYASLVSINVYIVVTVGWWIAARGGIAPLPSHSAIFGLVITSWIAVWLWRRYR